MRLFRHEVDGYFEKLWHDVDRPPWKVRAQEIEAHKVRLLSPFLHSVRTVLDCGCGGGDFLELLAPHGAFERVVGVDVASNALERARRTGKYHQLVRAQIDEAHRHVEGGFDLALLSDVLYYLRDFARVLDTVARGLVRPGGLLFLSVAVGRDYFAERDVLTMKRVLEARGDELVLDRRIDYRFAGVPRRRLPFRVAFAQTHKAVMVYRVAA